LFEATKLLSYATKVRIAPRSGNRDHSCRKKVGLTLPAALPTNKIALTR